MLRQPRARGKAPRWPCPSTRSINSRPGRARSASRHRGCIAGAPRHARDASSGRGRRCARAARRTPRLRRLAPIRRPTTARGAAATSAAHPGQSRAPSPDGDAPTRSSCFCSLPRDAAARRASATWSRRAAGGARRHRASGCTRAWPMAGRPPRFLRRWRRTLRTGCAQSSEPPPPHRSRGASPTVGLARPPGRRSEERSPKRAEMLTKESDGGRHGVWRAGSSQRAGACAHSRERRGRRARDGSAMTSRRCHETAR